MNAFGAFFVMELWLKGGYSSVPEEQLEIALETAKNYGDQSQVKNFTVTGFSNDTKFDTSILAWTNFWNYRQCELLGEGNFTPVRAEVVKCIMANESSMGSPGGKNSSRDVLQSLFCGDPCFWAITKIDPYAKGKSHFGTSEQVINVEDLNGNIINGSLVKDYNCSDFKIQEWFGDGSWKVYSAILSETNQLGGEYTYHYNKVEINMSICAGIGEYAYKLNKENGRLTEAEGVCNYNGSKNKQNYGKQIELYMQEMGDGLNGYKELMGTP